MSDLRDCLLDASDCLLGVRGDIGAQKADSYIITRTWSGERRGDGSFRDEEVKIEPVPGIKDFSHDIRIQNALSYKQGDLMLIGISRKDYSEDDLRTDTDIKNVEKLIKVGDNYYRTINIKENFISWDIQIRKVAEDYTERD